MSNTILLIDNYDSFVYNLSRYFEELGHSTLVLRNDAATLSQIRGMQPAAIVLSPGPCTPREAGVCISVIRQLGPTVPTLGVCLGHQAIVAACGGNIIRSAEPVHGRTSDVWHDGTGLFQGLPNPLTAARYHSLVADSSTLPATLQITARTADGVMMGVRHRDWPVYGVQFHPESTLTDNGHALLANFLRSAGLDGDPPVASERRDPRAADDFFAQSIVRDHPPPPFSKLR